MDSVKKILYFAVGIILTVSFTAIGFSIFDKTKTVISGSTAEYDTLIAKYSNLTYAMYEGKGSTATGSELKGLIRDLSNGNLTIYVKNGAYKKSREGMDNGAGISYNCKADDFDEALMDMSDRNRSVCYINPDAVFDCETIKDSNGELCALTYTQR